MLASLETGIVPTMKQKKNLFSHFELHVCGYFHQLPEVNRTYQGLEHSYYVEERLSEHYSLRKKKYDNSERRSERENKHTNRKYPNKEKKGEKSKNETYQNSEMAVERRRIEIQKEFHTDLEPANPML